MGREEGHCPHPRETPERYFPVTRLRHRPRPPSFHLLRPGEGQESEGRDKLESPLGGDGPTRVTRGTGEKRK